MSTGKPLVRSQQLTPLSHGHYDGLLFAWRIRLGLKKNASLELMNSFINWFWRNHLEMHFEDEEKNLLPHLPANDELGNKMLSEHKRIRELLPHNSIRSHADIALFAQILHDHIRFEERELFPYIEKKLSQKELDEISLKLIRESACSSEWKDEFWKD